MKVTTSAWLKKSSTSDWLKKKRTKSESEKAPKKKQEKADIFKFPCWSQQKWYNKE